MITELTKAQTDKFPFYVDKWLKIGLSTEPIDLMAAHDAIVLAYQKANLRPPTNFYFFPSPHRAIIEINNMSGKDKPELIWPTLFAQHEAGYASFYDFIANELGIDCSLLDGIIATIQTCGWWWGFEDVAVVCDRPKEIHRDPEHRLHNELGPALSYRDDWSLFAWHGLRVERRYITDPVTVKWIDSENNAELRRVLVSRYGMADYVRDSGATKIHSDDFGTLYKKAQPGDEDIFMVNVICPTTAREYMLSIDPRAYNGRAGKEARAAVASTWRTENGKLIYPDPDKYGWEEHT